MSNIDWFILCVTLGFIVVYGLFKTRDNKDAIEYLKGGSKSKWWTIGLGVMATQASAITFLSTPGEAYHSGMGFVQFYFGLPLAMVVLCITFIPIYYKLKVFTAYEYLETRFDLKTRTLTAGLFLVQRGLAAGITIYAPAIILSSVLGWDLNQTILVIGALVIIYTVVGGTKAVNKTQTAQMVIIFIGLIVAFFVIIQQLPPDLSFKETLQVAGVPGKLEAVNFNLEWDSRYNFWSGIFGGFFLALSYFGTDQSQVQRYLTGKSIRESRLGLLFNGLLKVPMQFFILFIGVMVFVFYQFNSHPLFFNVSEVEKIRTTEYAAEYAEIEVQFEEILQLKKRTQLQYVQDLRSGDESAIGLSIDKIKLLEVQEVSLRKAGIAVLEKSNEDLEDNDKDYVFISFITKYLPKGIVGLLLAMIFSAAMSSTAAELNALASTTSVDIYKRHFAEDKTDRHHVLATKIFTLMWGLIAILFATWGTLFENLIQLVNIIGSIFYGSILGVFLVAFYVKWVNSSAVFIAAIIAQLIVFMVYFLTDLGYLWFNVIGCFAVIIFACAIQFLLQGRKLDE